MLSNRFRIALFRVINPDPLSGAARMVVHYQPMLFKKAMIWSSETHPENKLDTTSALSPIQMASLNVSLFISTIVQVKHDQVLLPDTPSSVSE